MKFKTLLALCLISSPLYATEYQSFTDISYNKQDLDSNFESYSIQSQFYFDKKQALGPLDQFKYINTTSYLYGAFNQLESKTWGRDSTSIGGKYFIGKWSIGGGYSKTSHNGNSKNEHSSHLNLGYLINDNFLVKYSKSNHSKYGDSGRLSMQYNHQLNDKDYLGFNINSDEKAAMTYFTHLGDEQYLKVRVDYDHDAHGNKWTTNANYYFDNKTSIFASYHNDKLGNIGAKYFINENFALSASYDPKFDNIQSDSYRLSLTAQF